MQIGTIAAGAGVITTINVQFLPQFLLWNDAATLQGLRVNVLGDGNTVDLDTAGLDVFQGVRQYGQVANNFLLPLANGIVKNKSVEIIATNGGANAITLYGINMRNNGNIYFQSLKATVVADSGATFRRFAFLGLPNFAATDLLTIGFKDGLVQKFNQAELFAWLQLTQNDVSFEGIDNFDGKIDYVQLTPAANEIVHIMRFWPVGDVSQTL